MHNNGALRDSSCKTPFQGKGRHSRLDKAWKENHEDRLHSASVAIYKEEAQTVGSGGCLWAKRFRQHVYCTSWNWDGGIPWLCEANGGLHSDQVAVSFWDDTGSSLGKDSRRWSYMGRIASTGGRSGVDRESSH